MTVSARCRLLVFVILAIPVGLQSDPSRAADRRATTATTTRLILQAKAGADAGQILAEAGKRSRAARLRVRGIHGAEVHVIEVDPDHLDAMETALLGDPRIRFVERDQIVVPAGVAGDSPSGLDSALAPTGIAWASRFTSGSAEMPIAVLDSGVDAAHPALAGRVLPGWNVYDDNDDTRDVVGHGTLVAGIVAAATNDASGIVGVAPVNPILPIRVTDEDGNAYVSTLTAALVWAADRGARIANISFAVFGGQALSSAAQYFVNRGGLVFAAGGNDGLWHDEPMNDWVVSVAATTADDSRAAFASSGAYIDLAAPGVDLLSTAAGGGYARVSGTSVASPVAAGIAALAWAVNPSLSAVQVEDLLKSYSEDLGEAGHDPLFGWGRVDAARTVAVAAWLRRTADRIAPFSDIVTPSSGQTLRDAVTVTAAAADDVAVVAVDLLVDGRPLATSITAPHTFFWNTAATANGPHTLVVRARDAAGNVGTSAPVTVTVDNPRTRRSQRIRLRIRAASTDNPATLTVGVRARSDHPVTAIEVHADGTPIWVENGIGLRSLRFDWDTASLPDGPHTLSALARDTAGCVIRSQPVTVDLDAR